MYIRKALSFLHQKILEKYLKYFYNYYNNSTHQLMPIIFLNTMFHAPMGGFQLELIIFLPIFPPSSHSIVVFFFPVGLLHKPGDRRNFKTLQDQLRISR